MKKGSCGPKAKESMRDGAGHGKPMPLKAKGVPKAAKPAAAMKKGQPF
jgi:hypothetical protein